MKGALHTPNRKQRWLSRSVGVWVACLGVAACGRIGIDLTDVATNPEGGMPRIDAGDVTDAGGSRDGGDGDAGDTSAPVCQPVPGLLAHWPLDDAAGLTATERTGQFGEGALVNMQGDEWTTGPVDGALAFDGGSQYLRVNETPAMPRSLAFWMRADRLMATSEETSWTSPTAHGDPNAGWLNPEGPYAANESYANAGIVTGTPHDWHGFGIQLPDLAQVLGIQVDVLYANENPAAHFDIELSWDGGETYTTTGKAAPITVTVGDRTEEFGGPADDWGHAWTASELSDANFRVRLRKQGVIGNPLVPGVNYIQVKVFHTEVQIPIYVMSTPDAARLVITDGVLATVGLTNAAIHVDGVSNAHIGNGWQHITVTDAEGIDLPSFLVGGLLEAQPSFEGAIDDIRFFDHVLSEAEIRSLIDHPHCGADE